MSELDPLRPEVRSHIQTMDAVMADSMYHPEWRIIRAELLRLAAENAEPPAARGEG